MSLISPAPLRLYLAMGKLRQATWPKKKRQHNYKMKSRQETTSPDQIATVTAKPTISDEHL